jgi:hypothetical protein
MAGSDQISTSALSEAEAALVRRPPARAATATIAAAIMIITAIGAHAVSMKIHPFSPALSSLWPYRLYRPTHSRDGFHFCDFWVAVWLPCLTRRSPRCTAVTFGRTAADGIGHPYPGDDPQERGHPSPAPWFANQRRSSANSCPNSTKATCFFTARWSAAFR